MLPSYTTPSPTIDESFDKFVFVYMDQEYVSMDPLGFAIQPTEMIGENGTCIRNYTNFVNQPIGSQRDIGVYISDVYINHTKYDKLDLGASILFKGSNAAKLTMIVIDGDKQSKIYQDSNVYENNGISVWYQLFDDTGSTSGIITTNMGIFLIAQCNDCLTINTLTTSCDTSIHSAIGYSLNKCSLDNLDLWLADEQAHTVKCCFRTKQMLAFFWFFFGLFLVCLVFFLNEKLGE